MKTPIKSVTKVLKVVQLSFVMLTLTTVSVFAGGDSNAKIALSDSESYALALTEMAEALSETEELQNIYTPKSQIKVYDANYTLLKEAEVSEDGIVADEELLQLILQSTELMEFENISYYILNK